MPNDQNTMHALMRQYVGRTAQLQQLYHCFRSAAPILNVVVVHGGRNTGKTTITKAVLEVADTPFAIVSCQECITARHLLERTVSVCSRAAGSATDAEHDAQKYQRCESVNALAVHLERLLADQSKFVIVFDGIDCQREAPPTLLPALARLNERVPNLSVVLITTVAHHSLLHKSGTPHIFFPAYTREEAISIVSRDPWPIFDQANGYDVVSEESNPEDDAWLWNRFCTALWDSQAKGIVRDIVGFRDLAEKVWPTFVASVRDGTYGTRDFSRLMIAKRTIFQGDEHLANRLLRDEPLKSIQRTHDLSYYSKYLLCAAYLASFNPSRLDPVLFMKSSEKKRRKKGGAVGGGRVSKARKISRRFLTPSPFPLERLVAIFYSILPHAADRSTDIYAQIATLSALKLFQRTSLAGDILEPNSKLRVNVQWDYVVTQARSVGFEIGDYLAD